MKSASVGEGGLLVHLFAFHTYIRGKIKPFDLPGPGPLRMPTGWLTREGELALKTAETELS